MSARLHSPADPSLDRLKVAGDWLFRLHEEELDESEIAAWIQWCESDPENVVAFEEMAASWKELGELPAAVQSRLAALAAPRTTTPKRIVGPPGWRYPLAAAATLLFAAILTGLYLWQRGAPEAERVASNMLQAGVAQIQDARLPDGSSVALGAKSSLNIEFAGTERRLRMRDGQAYFQVKPDRDRPFIVEAGPVEVRAVGTAFDVRKNEGRVVVSVTEGLVDVVPRGPRQENGQSRVQVAAGYQYTWDANKRDVKLAAAEAATAIAWRSGRLEYFGEPLWAVISNVNRYTSQPVEIEDPSLGELQFTGTVFTASIEDWVRTLPQAFPVICVRRPDGSYVIRRAP